MFFINLIQCSLFIHLLILYQIINQLECLHLLISYNYFKINYLLL